MSKENCVINGKLCFSCCKVLTINAAKNFREWSSYARRYGYPRDYQSQRKVHNMVRQISKRRAKKINPRLIKMVGNNQSYFTCKNFTGSGCGNYENRPYMCSGYPLYGNEKVLETEKPIYRDDCTYFVEIK